MSSDPETPDASRTNEPGGNVVPRLAARVIYLFAAVAAAALLVGHSFRWHVLQVDTTSLGLIAILLLVPIAPFITKLKAAGVEAEIGSREAKQLQAKAADLPSAQPSESNDTSSGELTIDEIVSRDPILGLAKLRMDIEVELRRLYAPLGTEATRALSLGRLTAELINAGTIPSSIRPPLLDFTSLANRAVHGEYVPAEIARDIAQVGIRVLDALKDIKPAVWG